MKLKKMAALFAVATTVAVVAGCSSSSKETTAETTEAQTSAEETTAEETTEAETAETEEEEEENYNTGDASKDNPRNQDEIGEDELMVVSFGTSYNDNRRMTVGAIEDAIEKASPDYSVRRAFTSQIIIDHVKSRDNEIIDNVTEALDRAEKNGVKRLVIQPTHLMNGLEYTDLVNEVAERSDAFEKVSIGEPLLTSDEDFKAVMTAITEATAEYDDGETAICFMGHGTEADSNQIYAKMQDLLTEMERLAQPSPHFFPDDTLTDQPERVLAAEMIREKILRLMDKEIPHGIAVAIEKMKERPDGSCLDVDATIYCERASHKGMVIGKGGAMLKKIATFARQDMERFFGIKVNLHTWVKVKEDWRNREGLIHNFGLDNE